VYGQDNLKCAARGQKGLEVVVRELRAIISLDVSNREAKLCLDESTKIGHVFVDF
jgi:hypothetical protein